MKKRIEINAVEYDRNHIPVAIFGDVILDIPTGFLPTFNIIVPEIKRDNDTLRVGTYSNSVGFRVTSLEEVTLLKKGIKQIETSFRKRSQEALRMKEELLRAIEKIAPIKSEKEED